MAGRINPGVLVARVVVRRRVGTVGAERARMM